MKIHQVIRRPLITEKSTIGREEHNLATFAVNPDATKHDIRRAVEELFKVEVVDVRAMRQPRKTKRVGGTTGHKAARKKAIVKHADRHSIASFEGV